MSYICYCCSNWLANGFFILNKNVTEIYRIKCFFLAQINNHFHSKKKTKTANSTSKLKPKQTSQSSHYHQSSLCPGPHQTFTETQHKRTVMPLSSATWGPCPRSVISERQQREVQTFYRAIKKQSS